MYLNTCALLNFVLCHVSLSCSIQINHLVLNIYNVSQQLTELQSKAVKTVYKEAQHNSTPYHAKLKILKLQEILVERETATSIYHNCRNFPLFLIIVSQCQIKFMLNPLELPALMNFFSICVQDFFAAS